MASDNARSDLLEVLRELGQQYPDWRLGQTICNLTTWARMETELDPAAVWDVEDAELLAAAREHLSKRKGPPED